MPPTHVYLKRNPIHPYTYNDPDDLPYIQWKYVKLSVAYNLGDTGSISVADASEFSTFENVGVGTTNTGFLRIGEEIIEYSNAMRNML